MADIIDSASHKGFVHDVRHVIVIGFTEIDFHHMGEAVKSTGDELEFRHCFRIFGVQDGKLSVQFRIVAARLYFERDSFVMTLPPFVSLPVPDTVRTMPRGMGFVSILPAWAQYASHRSPS